MLTLALETSTATFAAALATADEVLATRAQAGVPPAERDLPGLVSGLLADAGRSFADVSRIAVDVGPGNLTAVRTGVAYGNGLAFALGAGVATANSLELMAAQAGSSAAGPVPAQRRRRPGVRGLVRRRAGDVPARAAGRGGADGERARGGRRRGLPGRGRRRCCPACWSRTPGSPVRTYACCAG